MNNKLFFLTTLSIFVFLFDKGSAKVPLRAKRGDELEPTNNETLPTSTTEEEISANNSTTTEGNEDGNEEEKANEDDLDEEDLPHVSHSTDTTTTSLDDYYGENMHAEETPNETDNKNITKDSDGENKFNESVDFDGKNCVLAEGKGIAFKIKNGELEYATNGSIKVRETKDKEIINFSMVNIENLSTKICGIGNYEQFSYCARLKFFGSKGIDIVKNSTLFERNNPKSISEYEKNYMQDMALVMIEGCVICGNSSNQTITLKFIQLHPKVMNF
ncbi:unnamed protein product [Meloidogyne enterolobii]|uniref:Uncharacterized protein n=1 Tax=Meloidogyne enterolobii TaxID=390850 RepID=A0ACB1ABT4_MELEN